MPKDKWTTANIPPQTGRLAVVTGATSGIGHEAALALARAGAQVVLAARNEEKAQRAMALIRRAHPSARLEFHPLDTARLASVREFGTRWQNEGQQLDILLLNAGIAAVPKREETEDGFERQFATNYLGHFALTGLLLPSIRSGRLGSASRIVQVASLAHRRGQIHFDDLQLQGAYTAQGAYRQSKLAMLMFGLELDRRLRAAGSPILSIPVHPGVARTDITRLGDRAGPVRGLAARAILTLLGQPAAQGALPLLFAATAPQAKGGIYYGPDGFWEARGYPAPADVAPHAPDQVAAQRLWSVSQDLTGVTYPF